MFNVPSKDAPEHFHILKREILENYINELQKNDSMTVLSKNKKWITINTNTFDRLHPYENMKVKKGESCKILPEWMKSKYSSPLTKDMMMGANYKNTFTGHTSRILVDKSNKTPNNNKSIFSFMDYRHNVLFENEYKQYQRNISNEPKKFFDWDDNKIYDPKKKRDYI